MRSRSRSSRAREVAFAPFRRRWPQIALGVGCLAVAALASAAYAYLTGPLLALVLGAGKATAALGAVSSLLPAGAAQLGLLGVALLLVAVALVKGLSMLGQALWLDGSAELAGHELRAALHAHVLALPLVEHRERARGEVLARLLDDAERVKEATVSALVASLRDGLSALALLAVALLLAPRLALVALVVLPLVALAVASISRRVRRAAERGQNAVGELSAQLDEALGAIAEIKSARAEPRVARRLDDASEQLSRWRRRRILTRAALPLFNEVLAAAGLGAALLYAGKLVVGGVIAPAALVSFFTAMLMLYKPIKGLGNTVQTVAAGRASLERIAELLSDAAEQQAAPLPPLERRLEARGLRYRYRHGDGAEVLAGVDLTLARGEIVAVSGASGAGKSTLLALLAGLDTPAAGALCWDGEPVTAPAALRGAVGYVPQQPLLLAGSVADNLRLAAPSASDAQLERALHDAGLDIERSRRVGSGASGLSVGQVQRLAIARA
ncbi:MAG: ABC transporter ATP-binding protein, partial [Myxococcales bacterium]|nr:ABC transporter ATP-binding protein [Myxococcales bacterium]